MTLWRWCGAIAVLLGRKRFESSMDEELQFHLEACVEDLVQSGLSRPEAERRAAAELGRVEKVKDECRRARGLDFFDELRQDVRYGWRSLTGSPGFTIVTVAALAIGIGATTAVFSIVNGILLESFPYRNPEKLVLLFEHFQGAPSKFGVSPPDFEILRDQARSYTGMAAYIGVEYELSGRGEPQRIRGARVSSQLFSVLGAGPQLGRLLNAEDDEQSHRTAVLTHGLWLRAFGRDPAILGQTVRLDGLMYTVVGVMPERFEFPPRGAELNGDPAELFVPISFTPEEREGFGMRYAHTVVARLKPGQTVEQARAETEVLVPALLQHYPSFLQPFMSGLSIPVVPLDDETVGRSRRLLLVLMGAVGIVLLMGCADVARLLLTRSQLRQSEIAVRASLGASPVRIARQLLTEAFTLAALGSALGLALAWLTLQVLLLLAGESLPRLESIGFHARVLGFALALFVVTPLLFGLVPAWRTASGAALGVLREHAPQLTSSRGRSRLLATLVVAQVALALVLSVGAGLLARSFLRLAETDPGFRPEEVAQVTVTLPSGRYTSAQQVRAFYDRAVEAARQVPGVEAVGACNDLPLNVREHRAFTARGSSKILPESNRLVAPTWVSPGYFQTLGISLLRGRFFSSADGPDGQLVVVINRTLSELLWPGENALGRQIKWGIESSPAPWMTIIGVVGDVKQSTLDTPTLAQVYVPLAQEADPLFTNNLLRTVNLAVRSRRPADSLLADLRMTVQGLDPALAISKAQPLTALLADSVQPQRFSMTVMVMFSAVALLLAAVGIYGALSSAVARQAHEIGVRLALGATPGSVIWMVSRRALLHVTVGAGLGAAAALAATRLLAGLLYEVRPHDAGAFLGAALVLALLALTASLLPLWRATRVDPLTTLKAG